MIAPPWRMSNKFLWIVSANCVTNTEHGERELSKHVKQYRKLPKKSEENCAHLKSKNAYKNNNNKNQHCHVSKINCHQGCVLVSSRGGVEGLSLCGSLGTPSTNIIERFGKRKMLKKAKVKRELKKIAFKNRSTNLRLPQAMAAKLIKGDNKNKNKSNAYKQCWRQEERSQTTAPQIRFTCVAWTQLLYLVAAYEWGKQLLLTKGNA